MSDSAQSEALDAAVRDVLVAHGRLAADAATIDREADLYAAGLTSHASVAVMLGVEDAFDVEFTPELLRRSTFGSVAAISDAVASLAPA